MGDSMYQEPPHARFLNTYWQSSCCIPGQRTSVANMSHQYSIIVSSLLRPSKLDQCLEAITRIPAEHRPESVVVVDDSGDRPEIADVCDGYRDGLPLELITLPYNSGLAKKRNVGLEQISTPYVLLLDDDQYVPSNIYELVDLLDADPSLGGVAPYLEEHGTITCNASDITVEDGWVLKQADRTSEPERTETNHQLFRYDDIPNSAMFRTAVFDTYTWDDFYTIAREDTDFYLTHKRLGEWEFGVTPNFVIGHDPGPGDFAEYTTERESAEKILRSVTYFIEKFDVKGHFHLRSHVPSQRSWIQALVRWLLVNLVPYPLLWWGRKQVLRWKAGTVSKL